MPLLGMNDPFETEKKEVCLLLLMEKGQWSILD